MVAADAVAVVGTLHHDYFAHHIVHYTSDCKLLVAGYMFHTGGIVADHRAGIHHVSVAHIVRTELGSLRIADRTEQAGKLLHHESGV